MARTKICQINNLLIYKDESPLYAVPGSDYARMIQECKLTRTCFEVYAPGKRLLEVFSTEDAAREFCSETKDFVKN
jgi:hypothetical protein